MSSFGIVKVSFAGVDASSSPQNISVSGVLAGDQILSLVDVNGNTNGYSSMFYYTVTTDGEIRQYRGDGSSTTFTAILARFS